MIEHNVEDELAMASYITQRRTYDVLALLLRSINPEDADTLMQMHEQGTFATSNPAFQVPGD